MPSADPRPDADGGETLANLFAVVGCDGTGKTSVVKALVPALAAAERRPVRRFYMGLVSGEGGDRIKALPLVGVALERYLAAKARRAQDMKEKVPGTFTAIVMYAFSLWRVFQMRRLVALAEGGVLVIAERYPQAEIPGFNYDGPGIDAARTASPLVKRLAAREQALYEKIARIRPTRIVRLTIDPETAHARKPDHPLPELRDKIAIMPRIGYAGAEVVEIDARMPFEQVLEATLGAIREAIPARPR